MDINVLERHDWNIYWNDFRAGVCTGGAANASDDVCVWLCCSDLARPGKGQFDLPSSSVDPTDRPILERLSSLNLDGRGCCSSGNIRDVRSCHALRSNVFRDVVKCPGDAPGARLNLVVRVQDDS